MSNKIVRHDPGGRDFLDMIVEGATQCHAGVKSSPPGSCLKSHVRQEHV